MTAITVELEDDVAKALRRLAVAQNRSETDILHEALASYVQTVRPLPKGTGQYHSGQSDGSKQARQIVREAVKESQWP